MEIGDTGEDDLSGDSGSTGGDMDICLEDAGTGEGIDTQTGVNAVVWLSDDMLLGRVVTGICAGGWLLWTGEGGVTSTGTELGIFL